MTDLSVWDIATDFSGKEAAALIVGEKPSDDPANWKPVLDRMMRAYQAAQSWHIGATKCDPEHSETRPARMLESIEMLWQEDPDDIDPSTVPHVFHSWLSDSSRSGFDLQRFTRDEIAQWIDAIGHKSVYQFAGKQSGCDVAGSEKLEAHGLTNLAGSAGVTDSPMVASRWPWGNHHTESLGHLEAAAMRYWVYYDPTDATTAPTNAEVSQWLQQERNVSRTMADSIASMLRLDGLRTGPRK